MKNKLIVGIIVSLLFNIARETGIINLNFQSTIAEINSQSIATQINDGEKAKIDIKSLDIPVSFLDYIPLYKTRSIRGKLNSSNDSGSTLEFKYDLQVTTKGFCSGLKFREIIRETIISSANK